MIHSLAKLTRPQSCHARTSSEDFDSATSVAPDVVKMTDLKLDPMLAEGGGEPGKNRFEQTNDINPFLLSARYQINNPRVRTRFEDGLSQDKIQLGHENWSISDPFDQAIELSSQYQIILYLNLQ